MNEETICPWFPACPIKHFAEKGLIDKKWVGQYCKLEYWLCTRKKWKITISIIQIICCLTEQSILNCSIIDFK